LDFERRPLPFFFPFEGRSSSLSKSLSESDQCFFFALLLFFFLERRSSSLSESLKESSAKSSESLLYDLQRKPVVRIRPDCEMPLKEAKAFQLLALSFLFGAAIVLALRVAHKASETSPESLQREQNTLMTDRPRYHFDLHSRESLFFAFSFCSVGSFS
jgi:hypothetical protein